MLLCVDKEGMFSLELNARTYTLRAKTDAEAKQWVKALLVLKESEGKFSESSQASTPSTQQYQTKLMSAIDVDSNVNEVDGNSSWIKGQKYCGCC